MHIFVLLICGVIVTWHPRMNAVLKAGLDKCFVRKMGFNFYVDLHVIVNENLSVREEHRIAHEVEPKVLRALPQISEVLVHVEPEEELNLRTR